MLIPYNHCMPGRRSKRTAGATWGVKLVSKPCVETPLFKTRRNSPTRLPSKSAVWDKVKRLCPDHPMALKGFTHTCTEPGCGKFFTLVKEKGYNSRPTTRAGEHLRDTHPDTSGKARVDRGLEIKVNSYLHLLSCPLPSKATTATTHYHSHVVFRSSFVALSLFVY